jgi:hypothetical protein
VLLPWLIIPRKVPNFSFRMLPYDPRQLGSFAEHTINYVKQEDGKAKVGFRSFPCPNYDRHRHQVDPLKDDCPLCRAGIAPNKSTPRWPAWRPMCPKTTVAALSPLSAGRMWANPR